MYKYRWQLPLGPWAIVCPPLTYANPGMHFQFISHDQVSTTGPALVPRHEPPRPGAGCFLPAKLVGAFCDQAAGCLLYGSNRDRSTWEISYPYEFCWIVPVTTTILGEMTDSSAVISAGLVLQLGLDCVDSFLRAKRGVRTEGVGWLTDKAVIGM